MHILILVDLAIKLDSLCPVIFGRRVRNINRTHLSTRQYATGEEIITAFSDLNKEFTLNHLLIKANVLRFAQMSLR